ncbi:MAG: PIN domain-containing protein [Candidatus Marsarchaeota archaeon]|jgi:predicted nucleic acid-binding protein|nr:PIN domain-containing protein [Candidatus Marsarchaeota archaeon]
MQDDKFIDTSVLVYAFDKADQKKHAITTNLIDDILNKGGRVIVSSQVLLELYNVLTRFISKPLAADEAKSIILDFFDSQDWIKLDYSASTTKRAITVAADIKVAIWDVLIAETMRENEIYVIVTENENDFRRIPGITVENPFK